MPMEPLDADPSGQSFDSGSGPGSYELLEAPIGMDPKLIDITQKRINELLVSAESHFGRKFPSLTFEFGLEGNTAGTALIGVDRMMFNLTLLEENWDDFLRHTVGHEVAHHVTYWVHGVAAYPHGSEWKKIMVDVFGLPATRCHSYDVTCGDARWVTEEI